MRKTLSTLVALLTASTFVVAGCGDDTAGTDTSTPDDTSTSDSSPGDTSETGDSSQGDSSTPDIDQDTNICGSRECGMFGGVNCGTCETDETCNAAGRCEVPGQPMGSFCGLTTTCNDGSPNWNDGGCIDSQCESRNCLGNSRSLALFRDVCSLGCTIYKDDDDDGVNDPDAPLSDCNPTDIVDGPAGDIFRCVNFARPGQNDQAVCVPGTTFLECNSDADCPTGEGCDLTTIRGDYTYRCIANNKAGPWGEVAGLSEACNDDPRDGDVARCESALCFGIGCVSVCDVPDNDPTADSLCDTTKVFAGTGCESGKCAGTTTDCTEDWECSSWSCGESRKIIGEDQPYEWRLCWPKDCNVDDDCSGGFYCNLAGWNGETGADAGWDKGCFAQNPEGVDQGEACDSNPEDGVPGAVCKNEDWCVGGYCGALCETDAECVADQKCITQESTGDLDDDGTDDIALPINFCLTFEDVVTPEVECVADTDCASAQFCNVYTIWDSTDQDGMMQLTGVCTNVDDISFPGESGDYGTGCNGAADCKSGYCLGATDTNPGYCSKTCAASTECGAVTIGEDTANGQCSSLLMAYGGNPDDTTGFVFINLCQLTLSSTDDCATDFACTGDTEVCFPNVLSIDPTKAPSEEYLCQAIVDAPADFPTKTIGQACDLNADAPECASGICFDDGAGNGYCSALCSDTVNTDCGNATVGGGALECLMITTRPRRGAYKMNSGGFKACVTNPVGQDCDNDYDCDGGYVCDTGGTCMAP